MELEYKVKRLIRRAFFRHEYDPATSPILIVSTRRSGSTWLAELISRSGPFCLIDQPFSYFHLHERRTRLAHCYEQAVPKFTDPAVRGILKKELADYCQQKHPVNSNWLPFSGFATRSSRVLVKELDAKFLAEEANIQEQFVVLVLVRSADGTVRSIMRNKWGHYLNGYLSQSGFLESLDDGQRAVTTDVVQQGGIVDKQFLSYCFENFHVRKLIACPNVKVLQYERLREEPATSLRNIATICGITPEALMAVPTNKPSRTSRRFSDRETKRDIRKDRYTDTSQALSSPMKERILKAFGYGDR